MTRRWLARRPAWRRDHVLPPLDSGIALYIGTSGWGYPEWKAREATPAGPGRPGLYPARLGAARFLHHYATVFSACEINTTFYGLRDADVVSGWKEATPEGFRFAAKVHRRLTHTKRISPRARLAFRDEFCASLQPLGTRLAALLWQFPPTTERDDELLSSLLSALPSGPVSTFEFRHASWDAPEIDGALNAAGAVRCVAGERADAPDVLPPGPFAYVRLRAERYSHRQRRAWFELLEASAAERDVFVFAKHRDVPAHDPFTGVGLARWIAERATKRKRRAST